eukprot:m.106626 g.106626  ORF g.106626 m.106626 type:complete len:349 (+) comp16912_c0_seq3:283-1329(+)
MRCVRIVWATIALMSRRPRRPRHALPLSFLCKCAFVTFLCVVATVDEIAASDAIYASAVFVKVPKTGSTTLRGLMNLIAKKSNFTYFDDDRMHSCDQMNHAIEKARRSAYGDSDGQPIKPVFASSHIPHCDFASSFLLTMAREPVARFVSHFYYTMYGPRPQGKKRHSISVAKNYTHLSDRDPSVNEFAVNLRDEYGERCLQKTEAPFNFLNNQHVYYFCGFPSAHEDCADVCSERALKRAIFNMKHGFDFVGVVEHFNASLTMLLKKMPPAWYSVFDDEPARAAEKILNHPEGGHRNVNDKKHTMEPPTEETKRLLRVFNANDVRLYNNVINFFADEIKTYKLEDFM